MTIAELQEMIVRAKSAGNSAGLTDREIGALEICELHADRKRMVPVNINIEMAELKHRGGKNYFIHFENKFKGIVIAKGGKA